MERPRKEDTDGISGEKEQYRVPRLAWKKKKGSIAKEIVKEEELFLLNKNKVRVQGI